MRRAITLLAWIVVMAACGGGSDEPATTGASGSTTADSSTTTGPGETFAEERLELVEARAANGGLLPKQAALDLFSAVFGDVPDADPNRFPVEEHDGTMAINAVHAVWDDLTAQQQEAIDLLLDGPVAAEASVMPLQRSFALLGVEAQVAQAQAEIESRIGRPLGIPVEVQVRPPEEVTVGDSPVNGYAIATRGDARAIDGPAEGCRFVLKTSAAFRTIVHEMFHCFQYSAVADMADVTYGQTWIKEGSASWVAARITGFDDWAAAMSQTWMRSSSSLFAIDYPALVFYWTIEDMGVNPFEVILGMLGHENEDAVAATGLDPADVLPRIATERAAAQSMGPSFGVSGVWQLSPPDAPTFGDRSPTTVNADTPYEISTGRGPWASGGVKAITFSEEGIAHVIVNADAGGVQFDTKDLYPVETNFDMRFCLRPEGCSCGSDEAEEAIPQGTERMLLAGIARGGGQIDYRVELDEFGDEFPEGEWEGTFAVTTVRLTAEGARLVGETLTAPFTISVDGGMVTGGSYAMVMDQRMDMGNGDYAEGVGSITGIFAGCADLPVFLPAAFSFEGVASFEGEVRPFVFDLPLGPSGPAGPAPWNYDERGEDRVTGSLDNTAHLEFMRTVGVDVADVDVRFEATRVG